MNHRKVLLLVLLLAVGTVSVFFLIGRGGPITADAAVYAGEGFYARVFSGSETPNTHWLVLGTSSAALRLVVEEGRLRNYLAGPGCFLVRSDTPFYIRVDRRWIGLVYAPHRTLLFPETVSYPPYGGNPDTVLNACRAALKLL